MVTESTEAKESSASTSWYKLGLIKFGCSVTLNYPGKLLFLKESGPTMLRAKVVNKDLLNDEC